MIAPLVPLRRMIQTLDNGAWGDESEGNQNDRLCVRAADFDYARLCVAMNRAPIRQYTPHTIARLELTRGDIVVEKSGGGENQPVGRAVLYDSAQAALCSNFAARLRPTPHVESKYLVYVLAQMYANGSTARCINQTTGIQNLDTNAWLGERAPLPPLDEQRRIADFLDDQVTRIDQVIALRKRQLELIAERSKGLFDSIAGSLGLGFPLDVNGIWSSVPDGWVIRTLGHIVREFTNGFVGPTRDILVDEGIPYIQSVHVKSGGIDFGRRPFFVTDAWHRARPRVNLRAGDVLIVQTGDIGQVAVVPQGFGEASCHALQIARARESIITGEYLGAYLRSHFGRQSMLSRATGALHPHLEASVKTVPVAVPPLAQQQVLVCRLTAARNELDELAGRNSRSVTLLQERKRSLITAAVTGEFDVSTASTRAARVAVGGPTNPAAT